MMEGEDDTLIVFFFSRQRPPNGFPPVPLAREMCLETAPEESTKRNILRENKRIITV